MTTSPRENDVPKPDHTQGRTPAHAHDHREAPRVTGDQAVEAPDRESGDKPPKVVVNMEFDAADNSVKLAERNVDPAEGESGAEQRANAKRLAEDSLKATPYGDLAHQIAARLRSYNVPVVAAEPHGEDGVRVTVSPMTGGPPLVYEAKGPQATPDHFVGLLRMAGYIG